MTSRTPKIGIIGGGPAGLCLARILHVNGISATIFESDPSPSHRPQGGSLDLHPRTGQQALKDAHLYDAFESHVRYEGQDLILSDKTGHAALSIIGVDTGRPEIDRSDLRKILLDSLPKDCIRWGSKVVEVDDHAVYLQDGAEHDFDLIVGADGAWSKVRPQLTCIRPFYAGIVGVELRFPAANERYPAMAAHVGAGSNFAFNGDTQNFLLAQRMSDGEVRMFAWFQKEESWSRSADIDWSNTESIKKMLLTEFHDWSDHMKDLIKLCDQPTSPRPLYMLPVGLEWEHHPSLTLLGDAAHLMTPFAGEGVNAALSDARELAAAIIAHKDDFPTAISEYEEGMWKRSHEIQEQTWRATLSRIRRGALEGFVNRCLGQAKRRGIPEEQLKPNAHGTIAIGRSKEEVEQKGRVQIQEA